MSTYTAIWVIRSFLDYRIPVFRALSERLDHNFYVIFSGDYVPDTVVAKAREALGERAVALSGEWKMGPEDRHSMANAVVSLRYQPGLVGEIRRRDPDVLICEGFFKWSVGGWMTKLRDRIPIVINYERTAHTERHAQWFRSSYRRLMLRYADAVCCNGRLSAEYVQSLGMASDHITTGHMVADTQFMAGAAERASTAQIQARRQAWHVGDGRALLYVGSLSDRKGVRELLDGWAQHERRHRDAATLVLVGDGDKAEELQAHARQLDLRQVHFAGRVPYDDLGPWYAAADAFIMPTLEDNWSLVVPEAMAAGLPVLCSRYNGCWPELVREERNGWTFDPRDRHSLVDALACLVDPATDLAALGRASREIIAEHTPESAAKAIHDACDLALGSRDTARAQAS